MEHYANSFRVKYLEKAIDEENNFIRGEATLNLPNFRYAYWLHNVILKINGASPEERRDWGICKLKITTQKEITGFIAGASRMIIEHSMGETLRTEQKHGGDTLGEVNAAETEKLPSYLLNLIGSGDDLQPRYFMLNGLENRSYFHDADKKAPRIIRISAEELQNLGKAQDLSAITLWMTSNKHTLRVADNRTDAF